jgi:hypothetical protein
MFIMLREVEIGRGGFVNFPQNILEILNILGKI